MHGYGPEPTATRVVSVDIGDPGTPEVTESVDLDTGLVSARQHGSSIRLVTQAGLPELDFVQPTGRRGVKTARQANDRVVQETTIEDWIPSYSVGGGEPEQLADCADMAIPKRELGLDTMNVIGFEADDPADLHTIGLAGSASLAYESPDHLYLAASPWATWGRCFDICPLTFSPALEDSGTTLVFDFEISGTEATYVGSGEVEGTVADRWAMDEYDGVLRLALGPTQATGNFNSVVTLERRGDELVEIGRVDKLGVNENIESVRWFDALAIVVTFRQVDPLYTIDLSDQDDPTLIGELKIPGFSEYLHPLGSKRLVGVGQGPTGEGGWGAQLGLFDVTDLTQPKRIDTLSYQRNSQALAGLDPRQFTWLPDERTLLTVVSKGWTGRTGWVSVVTIDDGQLTNRMVEADYGNDVAEIRTVPHARRPGGTGDRRRRRVLRPLTRWLRCGERQRRPRTHRHWRRTLGAMCRNIRQLHNFDPPASKDEVYAAALQYVRKVSGSTKPSKANQEAFDHAVHEVAHITRHLLDDLVTNAPPKDREVEAQKARARAELRYGATG